MKTIKTTVSVSLLASAIAAGTALFTAPAVADGLVDMSIHEINGKVHLIVKRQLVDGTTKYDRVTVPASEADKREAELLQDPNVLLVERDVVTYNPVPLTKAPVSRIQSLSIKKASEGAATYADPLFNQQDYFTPGHEYNSRLSEAHQRLDFTNTIRIGIVDGGFVRSADVNYVEGVSLANGRGPEFYNSDANIECPFLQPGEDMSIHGHFVSQVAGATSNNGLGIAGASPNVELVAARSMNCTNTGILSDNAESVRWLAQDLTITDLPAISEPVDVINMSLAAQTSCPSYMQDAIDFATSKGISVVVAAGNDFADSTTYAPANCDGVITVAATTANGYRADYTNAGDNITISAQGSAIPALDENGAQTSIYGTSFASPLVAGIIASALSERPALSPSLIDSILTNAGKPVRTFSNEPVLDMGAGILDAMLFLDGAGVARETVTVQPALSGAREQFTEALTHPAAAQYLQARTGAAGVCDIVEVNGETPTGTDSIAVFSVAQGDLLSPLSTTANIVQRTDTIEAMAFTVNELSAEASGNRQLGVAHCDLTTGTNCSVKDTIKALDISSLPTPTACI